MGIQGLRQVLKDHASKSMTRHKLWDYSTKRIAVDASNDIYQYLIEIRKKGTQDHLKNKQGYRTSHIQGFWQRTIKFLECGIEPIYVFDGTAPEMKRAELARRAARRQEAGKRLAFIGGNPDGDDAKAKDAKDKEVEELIKSTIKPEPQEYVDCQRLLQLMGVPVIQAPSEAEAQCAHLCKYEKVYGVSTEDSDALAFGAPRVLMNFKAKAGDKNPKAEDLVREFNRAKMLDELKLSEEQFIDLCIMSGCDYCSGFGDIDAENALELIHKHGSIEKILDTGVYKCPDNWAYKEARQLFKKPDVLEVEDEKLEFTEHKKTQLKDFLVTEHAFDEDRFQKNIQKIVKNRQPRLAQPSVRDMFKRKAPQDSDDTEEASKKIKA